MSDLFAGTTGILLLLVIAVAYFVPAIVANQGKTKNRGTVTVLNIFLGWTFIGWVIALAMAFGQTEDQT